MSKVLNYATDKVASVHRRLVEHGCHGVITLVFAEGSLHVSASGCTPELAQKLLAVGKDINILFHEGRFEAHGFKSQPAVEIEEKEAPCLEEVAPKSLMN